MGGCYLTNRITTKLHLHFPLPHYNDTVLYSKTNFYKSHPPQLPQQLGCAISQTGLPQNSISTSPSPITMTPCYILKRSLTKVNLLNTPDTWGAISRNRATTKFHPFLQWRRAIFENKFQQKPTSSIPPTWGGGLSHKPDYHKTLTSTFPLTIMWCYIQNDLLQTSTSSIPPTVGGWLSHKPDYHKTPPPLLTMMSCYILKQTSTKVNLLNSPNKNPKIWGLWVTIVAPLIFDQRFKKQNLHSKTNKQTKTQGLLVTSWSCFPPYLLSRPLPPPPPLTSSPSPNGDTILKLWCCQIRLGKYRPFPSTPRILCFLAKIDPFPKNYNSF